MKIRRLPEKEFKYIYSKVPRLCVEAVIKTDEGILLAKRDIPPAKGNWHIPGGTVLWGETLREAVTRIAKVEVGLNITPKRVLDVLDYSSKSGYGQSVGVLFLCRRVSGTLQGSNEGKDIGFFKSLPKPMIPEHKKFLVSAFGDLV